MKKLLLTFISLAIFIWANGQNKVIKGSLIDSSTLEPLPYVSVSLAKSNDSSSKAFTISNQKGQFSFEIADDDDFLLIFAFVGYAVKYISKQEFEKLKNGLVQLSPQAYTYAEFVVTANKIPIIFNGDSIVYNAESFKTRENADVEELLRRLPGVQINKDGSIQVEGGNVTRILVNGKEFFGGNISAATKNLDAKMVDKIQVIDREVNLDELEKNDGQREKVINVVLKKQYNQGYFGNISASVGLENQHDLKANMNFFREKQHLTIIAGKNNLDRRIFGWKELKSLNNFAINPLNSWNSYNYSNGILSPLAIGVNMHSEFSEKLIVDISTVFSDDNTLSQNTSESEVYLDRGTLFNNGFDESNTNNQSQQYNIRLEYKPDTLTTLIMRARYEKIDAITNSENQNVNFLQSGNVVNSSISLSNEFLDNYRLSSKLFLTRVSKKNKQNKLIGSIYYGEEKKDERFNSFFDNIDNIILQIPTQYNPIINRNLNTSSTTMAFTSGYQIQLKEKTFIRPGINGMTTTYNHDFRWQERNELIPANSPFGTVQSNKLEYYLHLNMPLDSFLKLYIVPEVTQIIEDRNFTTVNEHPFSFQNFFFTPYIYLMGNKPQKYNTYAGIYTQVSNPQLFQFIPAVDNSSPFRVRVGDIELVNNISYNAYYRYVRILGLKRTISFNGNSSYSINPILTDFTVDNENVATLTYVNAKYAFSSYGKFEYTYPITKLKAIISHNINYGYSENFSKRNNAYILSQSHNPNMAINVEFNEFEKWNLSLDYNFGVNIGSIDRITNNFFTEQRGSVNLGLNFSDRLSAYVNSNVRILGANETSNQLVVPIINSGVTYILDKKNQWNVGINAFDLLDRNQQIWRYWGNNQFTSNQQLAIQRYVLLNLTYRIKKKDKKPEEDYIIID
jgi:hypothetical protein